MLSTSTTNQSNCPRSSYEELKGQIFTNGIDFARISLNNKQVGKTPPPPTKKKIKKSLNRGILQPLMYHEQHKWYTVKKIHVLIVESHTEYINFVSYICQYIYYTIINKYFFFTLSEGRFSYVINEKKKELAQHRRRKTTPSQMCETRKKSQCTLSC